jgi:2-methylcitrate dehydratase PrpD
MWKNAASAATGRATIFATELAAKGMTGPAKAFEGHHGLWDQRPVPFEAEIDPRQHGYRVSQSDIKAYPSCGSTQAVLWTLLEMSPGLVADDVETIEVRTHWDTWFETAMSTRSGTRRPTKRPTTACPTSWRPHSGSAR